MKNWNYIEGAKVGNAFSHGDEVLVNSPDWKGMAVVLSQTGSKVRIYSSDGEVVVEEKYVRKVGNQKVGNGLLDMFKKNKTIKMKKDSGEIVTIYSDGESAEQKDERSQMLVHKHNSQKEAMEYYKNKGYKVGNDTPWEYAHRKPKVINDDKTGAEEFFKKLSDDVKEREEKDDKDIEKVGNDISGLGLKKGDTVKVKSGMWSGEKGKVTGIHVSAKDQTLEVEVKLDNGGYVVDDQKQFVKVGNKVVWKEGPYRIEEVEKDGKFGFYNIPKGSFNAYRNSVLYGNFKTLDSAKAKMNEEIRLDKEYNRKYTTNSKTGNATPNYRYKDFLITNPEGHEYIVFLKDGRTVGYRGTTSKAQAEDWCDWHDPKTGKSIGNKTGNSAQDDKFAYVMREFDEGKLKTPDGKVVTDPAQAKAIAYSESKKTENGLARARKAMAGNASSITYDDFLRKLENAINQGRESVSFQMYGISNQTVETWAKKAKKEGYSQYIRDVRGAEVNLND